MQVHAVVHAELAKGLVIDLPHLIRDRAGGRDHDDLRVLAAGEFDEAAEVLHLVLAVFVAADDDQVAVAFAQLAFLLSLLFR